MSIDSLFSTFVASDLDLWVYSLLPGSRGFGVKDIPSQRRFRFWRWRRSAKTKEWIDTSWSV